MKGTRAAERYAGALLGLSSEMKKVDEVAADMRLVYNSIASSHELDLLFKSPVVNRFKKRGVVEGLFAEKINPLTLRFLILLIDKGREALVDKIAVEFAALLDQLLGIVTAELKAPYELDEKTTSRLRARLEKLVGKTVRISFLPDSELLGGFLVQIDDTVYDGSVRRQLEILKQQLSEEVSFQS